MAISWGKTAPRGVRVGIDYFQTPAKITSATTSVTITWKVYIRAAKSSGLSGRALHIQLADALSETVNFVVAPTALQGIPQLVAQRTMKVTPSLAGKLTRRLYAGRVNAPGVGAAPSHERTITIAKRPHSKPSPPTGVMLTYEADDKLVVNWQGNSPGSSDPRLWVGLQIDRWNRAANKWSRIATLKPGVSSYTDTKTIANNRYQYRVRSYNDAGGSTWVNSGYQPTTPASPNNIKATKSGSNVAISWSNRARYHTGFRIYDGATQVGEVAAGVTTFTHANADPGVAHSYRVRAIANSRISEYSEYSNAVQPDAPPLAPTNLVPNGISVAQDEQVYLTWLHNPTDSSDQRQYQIRYRQLPTVTYTSLPVVVSPTEGHLFAEDSTLSAGGTFEWQVRTWGNHGTAGPYSSTAVFTVNPRPRISINSPSEGDLVTAGLTSVEWTFDSDLPIAVQAGYEIKVTNKGTGGVVYSAAETTDATSAFTGAVFEDARTYVISVRLMDSNGLWSDWDTVEVYVQFIEPRVPEFEVEFDRVTGGTNINIDNPEEDDFNLSVVSNRVYRSITPDEVWLALEAPQPPLGATNRFVDPSFENAPKEVVRGTNYISSPLLNLYATTATPTPERDPDSFGNWEFGYRAIPNFGMTIAPSPYIREGGALGLEMSGWILNASNGMYPLAMPTEFSPTTGGDEWNGLQVMFPAFLRSNVSFTSYVTGTVFYGIEWQYSNDSVRFEPLFEYDNIQEWVTMTFEGAIAPAGVIGARPAIYYKTSNATGRIPVKGMYMQDGSYFGKGKGFGDYAPAFNGDTPVSGPASHRWVGERNNSWSEEYIPAPPRGIGSTRYNYMKQPRARNSDGSIPSGWNISQTGMGTTLTMTQAVGYETYMCYRGYRPATSPASTVVAGLGKFSSGPELAAGKTALFSAMIASSTHGPVDMYVVLRNASNAIVWTSPVTSHSLQPVGVWGSPVEPSQSVGISVVMPSVVWTEGELKVSANPVRRPENFAIEDEVMIAVKNTYAGAVGDFFDGSSPVPTSAIINSWTGAVNNSISKQERLGIPSMTGGTGREVYISDEWSYEGQTSLCIVRAGMPIFAASGARSAVYPPGEYTAMAYCYIPEGYNPAEDVGLGQVVVSRGIYAYGQASSGQAQAPSTPGVHLVKVNITLSVENSICLGGGGAMGGRLFWDMFTVVDGHDYPGLPFSGGSGTQVELGYPVGHFWLGEENNSASIRDPHWPEFDTTKWELVSDVVAPNSSVTDWEALTNGDMLYLVQAITGMGSRSQSFTTHNAKSKWIWLSSGQDFDESFGIPFDVEVDEEVGFENQTLYHFDGRELPMAVVGAGLNRSVSASGSLDPVESDGATRERALEVIRRSGIYLHRDNEGRRIYGVIDGVKVKKTGKNMHEISYEIEEIGYVPGIGQ